MSTILPIEDKFTFNVYHNNILPFLFFSHTLHLYGSLLSSSPISWFFLTSLLPQIHCYSISHRNRTDFLLGISAEHGITRHNKNRQKHSYKCQMKYPRKRKRVPRASKKIRDTPAPADRSPAKTLTKQPYIHRENLAQTYAASVIPLQTCETLWTKQNLNNDKL